MFEAMKYVYQVYKEASFSKAAKNLYISQPSLSACIKKEEDRLGVKLFNRNTTPIQLTPPGKIYIEKIEQLMEIEDDFQRYINDFQNLKTGTLAIGANNIYTSFLLPQIINEYHMVYPDISITVNEGSTSLDIREALAKGITDIALDNFPYTEEAFNRHYLFDETLYLVVPKSFEVNQSLTKFQIGYDDIINNKAGIPSLGPKEIKKLADIPYVTLKNGSDNRKRFDTIMSKYDITPNVAFELDQSPSAYYIASGGLGACFTSDTLLKNIRFRHDLYIYYIEEPELHRNVYIYSKKNKYLSKSITEFFKIASNSSVLLK